MFSVYTDSFYCVNFFIYTTVQIFFDCHFRLVPRYGLAYPYTDAAALRLTYAFRVGALLLL
jgi:hypothetical protein